MGKIAFVFPGQGAQYVGMGKDFYEQIPACREVFELASRASGLDIPGLCFEENEKLHITEYTQIAMLTVSAAILRALEEQGVHSQVNAGLSLGEYGALLASGVLEMEDAFRVVRQRGILMQEAVPTGGAMAAVLGLEGGIIAKICEKTAGIVSVANYNCPGQIVITGEEQAVAAASESLKAAGAKRVVPLNVSGPFHSAMLKTAGEKLGKVLEEVEIHEIRTPYLTNVTGDYVADTGQIRQLLAKQVSSSVLWQQSVERMIADGVILFVEIGPGKTLTGFLRKINRSVRGVNIETMEDLEKAVKIISEETVC
ncbi:MAG: ACP S-malonyltransferase [Candidatus Limivivens sp.]|nr:ACP S-malonyltransferase [Candidatus Limivivens sp.]